MDTIAKCRRFLKAFDWRGLEGLETDQKKEVTPLPAQKPVPAGAKLYDLVPRDEMTVGRMPLIEAIGNRRSRRKFTGEGISLEELSFLLWATQGVKEVREGPQNSLRTVPSGGARHPFETYLLINKVEQIPPGLYRYLPIDHKLCFVSAGDDQVERIDEACFGQYIKRSAVTFIWTVIPYRSEWRYSLAAHRTIAQDSGHLGQNLYLAVEGIGAGTCALGAYDQEKIDAAIGVDGEDEFTIYMSPVGRI
jgi:SagB-type dehydrogenase family enzyme